jgi:hypothetical protein
MGRTSIIPIWLEEIVGVFNEARKSKIEMTLGERPIMPASYSLPTTRMGTIESLLG